MAIKLSRPTTPSRRHYTHLITRDLHRGGPKKSLTKGRRSISGRNNVGKITIRHRGGGHKRLFRTIDFKRQKLDVPALVKTIEYDPNRTSNIALLSYQDGDYRYILAPEGLKAGDTVTTTQKGDAKLGNCLPLKNIPVGTPIHNLELTPGKGGQLIRSAGSQASIQSKEAGFAAVLLPSKEIRLVKLACFATIGAVSNPDHQNAQLGKAGRSRHLGIRPSVRGTAMHPAAHPHGGGEGRSGVGLKYPKTPWGKHALGTKTRNVRRYSNKYLIRDRRLK